MRYVREKKECSGCRACEQECPQNCIIFSYDEEGFLYPSIDEKRCIDCGHCLEICNRELQCTLLNTKEAYAVKNRKELIRKESSSGGVFYELAMETIRRKGIVYGAAFDEKCQVHQIGADTERGIQSFMGSKYVQSDTESSYQEVKRMLLERKFVLYSGTPCQIKGLKQYLNMETDNLVCVSVICHGVPSRTVWNRYVHLKMGHYAEGMPIKISFRNKDNGWRNMHLEMVFSKYSYSSIHSQDLYFQGFSQNLFLRPACYQCRAKEKLEYVDIVIGDFWGIEDIYPEMDDGKGVSAVIINTQKGKLYWQAIKNNFFVQECLVEDIERWNPLLYRSVSENPRREKFYNELRNTGLIEESIKHNLQIVSIPLELREHHQYNILFNYLKKKIHKENIFQDIAKQGYHNICLYAVTDVTELVASDLLHSKESKLTYICDRNYEIYKGGIWGIKVEGKECLISDVKNNRIDLIIVCNIMREDEIFDELLSSGILREKIISIKNLICE